MVSLSNQARLLAAQAFNKKVLEQKAAEKRAEIEAERKKDLARTTRRLEQAKANARNAVERQRIQTAINEQLATRKEKERQAKINVQAKQESAKAFTRVAKGSNIGVLTGFEAKKDSKGRTVGISTKESATRKNTRKLLQAEIERQKKIAREGTDLERFLKNEQAINQGQVSSAELKRQIAQRKARGLSKTPAQKRASQFFADQEFSSALDARAKRKGGQGRATFGTVLSERARAGGLGSKPFIDPLFAFGGRTKKAQVARGGTFGRRAGGESISSQLSFISSAKAKSTSGRINFAQGLLSNLNFSGSSQQGLLSIVGQKKLNTPKTFEQELRAGQGFFTTIQAPVTKATITKGQRGQLVARRKAEDFAKTQKARETIAKQARDTTQPVFNLDALSDSLDARNLQRGRAIESRNALAPPRFTGDFSLGGFGVTSQRQQAQAPREISLIPTRNAFAFGEQVPVGQKLTPSQKRRQAEATQRETNLLRNTPFRSGGLVQATGRPSSTETFFPNIPSPDRNIFNVSLSENLGISDVLSPTPTRAPQRAKKGKKGTGTRRTTPSTSEPFSVLNVAGLIAPASTPSRSGGGLFGDIFGEAREEGGRAISGGVREASSGIQDFFGLDIDAGFGSGDSSFGFGEAISSAVPLLDTGFDFLR